MGLKNKEKTMYLWSKLRIITYKPFTAAYLTIQIANTVYIHSHGLNSVFYSKNYIRFERIFFECNLR